MLDPLLKSQEVRFSYTFEAIEVRNFLAFIALVLIASLALVAGYAPELRRGGALDDFLSRETAFLAGNLLLSVVTFTVLLGTLFPLVAEAVRGVRVSVGGPFFNQMTLPVIVVVLFLLGVGPALPWRRTDRTELKSRLVLPLAALAVASGIALTVGTRDVYAVLAFGFGAFALVSNVEEFWIGARARIRAHGESVGAAFVRLVAANRHRYGGYIAHIGLILSVLGIAASATFKTEREITLAPGQSVTVSGREFRLERVWGRQETGRTSIGADVAILANGRVVDRLEPVQHFYESSDTPVPTPAVRSTAVRDLYVNLMAFKEDGSSATIRVLVEPLVVWIWLGGGVVCFGALVALWPRRRVTPLAATHMPRATHRRPVASRRVPAEVTS